MTTWALLKELWADFVASRKWCLDEAVKAAIAALPPIKLPKKAARQQDGTIKLGDHIYNTGINDCAKAIESSGLRWSES